MAEDQRMTPPGRAWGPALEGIGLAIAVISDATDAIVPLINHSASNEEMLIAAQMAYLQKDLSAIHQRIHRLSGLAGDL